jgi:hypothetical protein
VERFSVFGILIIGLGVGVIVFGPSPGVFEWIACIILVLLGVAMVVTKSTPPNRQKPRESPHRDSGADATIYSGSSYSGSSSKKESNIESGSGALDSDAGGWGGSGDSGGGGDGGGGGGD